MNRLLIAAVLISGLFQVTHRALAQDSLRIIELSGPGESAPVNVPEGHAFTFSLFSPESGRNDGAAVQGSVYYAAPISDAWHVAWSPGQPNAGWFLGPATVVLHGNSAGARMQLYTMRLPPGVVSGILTPATPTHSVIIPKGSLLSSHLGFTGLPETFYSTWPANEFIARPLTHELSVRTPGGIVYAYSDFRYSDYGSWRVGTPRVRGSAGLHNPNAPASLVVNQFYYDDLDSVSPTADFVGPGTATFSLPPKVQRQSEIAFYCYRITPANVIGADASPPVVKVTAPITASVSTTLSSFVLEGEVTDNINPTSIRFRTRPPGRTSYGAWASVDLSGDLKTKSWQHTISLPRKGEWLVQVQAFDDEKNGSTGQTLTLIRQ